MFLLSNKVSLNGMYDKPDSAVKFAIYVKKNVSLFKESKDRSF